MLQYSPGSEGGASIFPGEFGECPKNGNLYLLIPLRVYPALWDYSFLSYAANKQTTRRHRTSYPRRPWVMNELMNE